jgi:hypothetical protein
MPAETLIDDRLKSLERDVADLKQHLMQKNSTDNWLDRLAGSMKDEPDFDQVLELGKELRRSEANQA